MEKRYYRLADGRIYGTAEQDFVALPEGIEALDVPGGSVADLVAILDFYGIHVGDCLLNLEKLKARKLAELAADFEAACQKAKVTTPAGWVADANEKANTNVEGLIKLLEATDPEAMVQFCGADNTEHEIDLAGLKALQLQIIQNGQHLYQAKWLLRDAIELASSREELNALGRLSLAAGHSA